MSVAVAGLVVLIWAGMMIAYAFSVLPAFRRRQGVLMDRPEPFLGHP